MLGLETPGMTAQRQAAEARAIGAACRHAVRSIEDCFASNPRHSRAAIFEGWREMDQHMRDNEIDGMPSPPAPAGSAPDLAATPGPATPTTPPTAATIAAPAAAAAAQAAAAGNAPATGSSPAANTPGGARPATPPVPATAR